MPSPFRKQICKHCGQPFSARRIQSFCSRSCAGAARTIPPETRFWKHVIKQENGCWLWIGAKHRDGYGWFGPCQGRPNILAHRYSYLIHYGILPEQHVCHHCDNPACVCPDHLFIATHSQNMADASAKNRFPDRRGERNNGNKYSTGTILSVFSLRAKGLTQMEISSQTGVSQTHISRILKRKSWAHLMLESPTDLFKE